MSDRDYLAAQGGDLSYWKGNPMQEQQKTDAQRALEALDQAWAYFTPEKRVESQAPVYEDLPLAA